jgi:hypothetical protein
MYMYHKYIHIYTCIHTHTHTHTLLNTVSIYYLDIYNFMVNVHTYRINSIYIPGIYAPNT